MCSKHKRLKRIIMKQKLLKVMIAFIAIVMPNLSYAQSQEAAGTYNGTLGVKVGGNARRGQYGRHLYHSRR